MKKLLLAISVLAIATGSAIAQENIYKNLQPTISGTPLNEVPAQPFAASGVVKRPFFDYFNWQNFIALMWPSKV